MDNSAFAKAPTKRLCVAFYNLENLFDTVNDANVMDSDFTPSGQNKWNEYKYEQKLEKLASVISKIGQEETKSPPSLVGIAEAENRKVLQDLIETNPLAACDYGIVHYDSPDERGIDVGLLYRKTDFEVINSVPYSLDLETESGGKDFTRDILYIFGNLYGIPVHLLVNHWPSRRSGENETAHKRTSAARRNRDIIDTIKTEHPNARIIVMGDFNDDPHSKSVKNELVRSDLYNPMIFLLTRYEGSLNHKFQWYLFDQIILTPNFMQMGDNPLRYEKSDIYNPKALQEAVGKFKGNPLRTYAGQNYLGGYSDHFPVYTLLKIRQSS